MELARSLGGGSAEGRAAPPPAPSPETPSDPAPPGGGLSALLSGGADPRLLEAVGRFLSDYQGSDDRRAALLEALRPFLRPERGARLDQAIRLSHMTRAVRLALTSFRSGRDDHV